MPYTPPGGAAAHFSTQTVSGDYYVNGASDLRLPIDIGGAYTEPGGQVVHFQQPAEYVRPTGDAANFVDIGGITFEASGAVTVAITASGSASYFLPPGIGDGAATVGITASGSALHGVAASGAASVDISASGSAVRGVVAGGAVAYDVFSAAGAGLVERYEVRGEVRIQGGLFNRLVRVYRRDTGELVGEQNTTAGVFHIHCGFVPREHYLLPLETGNDAEDWSPPCANRVVSVLAQDAA